MKQAVLRQHLPPLAFEDITEIKLVAVFLTSFLPLSAENGLCEGVNVARWILPFDALSSAARILAAQFDQGVNHGVAIIG